VIANGEVWVTLLGPGPQLASGPVVLGATGDVRSPSSVVWVRVPNVRAALGLLRSRAVLSLSPPERRQLAVAIGRVIAHEVVHARVPALPHSTGLMSGTLNRQQLTGGSIPIETEVALALQAALRGDPVYAPWRARLLATDARLSERDRWDR
jgi:hypothetical protein